MRKQLISLLLISFFLLLLVPIVSTYGETKYKIQGYVYNKDQTGAPGIKIEIIREQIVIKSVKSDGSGKYRLDVELLEMHEYIIQLSHDKYQTQVNNFTTPGDSNTDIYLNFTINKNPIVDVNGEYEGFLLDPILFDSHSTYDPDNDSIEYSWSFGDGEYSSISNPTHIYKIPGEYIVVLEVTDSDGATSSESTKCSVENRAPIVVLNGPYEVKEGIPVAFNSSGTYDPDGVIVSYEWDFDDGMTSQDQTPTHIYLEKGDYSVELSVIDEFGLESHKSTKCIVSDNKPPIAETNGPYVCYAQEITQFDSTGTHDPDDLELGYLWDFGDGETSNQMNPLHRYQLNGTYYITLTVTDETGAIDVDDTLCTVLPPLPKPPKAEANGPYYGKPGKPIYFSSSGSTDEDGEILEYLWDFEDGEFSTNQSPVHIYLKEKTYTITLTLTDDTGLTSNDTTECKIAQQVRLIGSIVPISNKNPIAKGNGPYLGIVYEHVQFSSSGSFDPDGEIISYHWSFGDGEESLEANPIHIFKNPGNNNITLTVTDNQGENGTYTTNCVIKAQNQLPSAYPNGPYTCKVSQKIQFNSTGSFDPDGKIIEYLWNFSDGVTVSEKNPIHTYSTPGTYKVFLTVIDDDHAKNTTSTEVTVTENLPPKPIIDGPTSGEAGKILIFDGTNSLDSDGEIIRYLFDFGDNTLSYESRASHIYTTPGKYTITLTVIDNHGLNEKAAINCTIFENKPPEIISDGPYQGSEDKVIEFNPVIYDPDGTVTSVVWNFGDGTTSNKFTPTHIFSNPGIYLITVTLTDNLGKKSSITTNAYITENEWSKFPKLTSIMVLLLFSVYIVNKNHRFLNFYN
jgi:PKD repeat protein